MIANAGSNATFRPALDAGSSREDQEEEPSAHETQHQDMVDGLAGGVPTENYMTRSLPGLKPLSRDNRRLLKTTIHDDSVMTSQILERPADQPEMAQSMEGQGDDAARELPDSREEDEDNDDKPVVDCVSLRSKEDDTLAFLAPEMLDQNLARQVAQIFQFEGEEKVVAGMPDEVPHNKPDIN